MSNSKTPFIGLINQIKQIAHFVLIDAVIENEKLNQNFLFNTVIPITHPCFGEINRIIQNLKSLHSTNFNSIEDLLNVI